MKSVVVEGPIYLDVRDIKKTLKCSASKSEAERVPDLAVSSIASYEELCLDGFGSARSLYVCGNSVFILRKTFKLRLPAYISAVLLYEIVQQLFVLSLFNDKQKRKRTHSFSNILQKNFAAYFAAFDESDFVCDPSACYEFAGDTDLIVDLKSARLHTDRSRKRRGSVFRIDDNKIDVMSYQLDRESETSWTGANDQNLCIHTAAIINLNQKFISLPRRNMLGLT